MANDLRPLIGYIDFCKKQGYDDGLIMKKLLLSGYRGDQIEMAFSAYGGHMNNKNMSRVQNDSKEVRVDPTILNLSEEHHEYNKRMGHIKFYSILFVIIVLIVFLLAYLYNKLDFSFIQL